MTRRSDLKYVLKRQLRELGWDVRRYSPNEDSSVQILRCLKHVNAEVVFDVGANTGEFAEMIRDAGFAGKIVSFEPLSQAHQSLMASAQDDTEWVVHPRCAVGDFEGEIEINVAGNSVSSSVLPMLKSHSDAADGSDYIGTESVQILKLDDLVKTYLGSGLPYVVKIDTQGFEWQVLDGACETVKKASGVLCEMSLTPLYEGQRLWLEIIDRLQNEGFTLWALMKGFTDQKNGRSMQVDGFFLRE